MCWPSRSTPVTPSPCAATRWPSRVRGRGRAAEAEPRAARFQHVHRLVGVAGLRAAVGGPPHAEGGRVVVRRLLGVPDREHHGVHADNRKEGAVLRWPSHADRVRSGFSNCATNGYFLLVILSINPNG